jgi:hypothetical protein
MEGQVSVPPLRQTNGTRVTRWLLGVETAAAGVEVEELAEPLSKGYE